MLLECQAPGEAERDLRTGVAEPKRGSLALHCPLLEFRSIWDPDEVLTSLHKLVREIPHECAIYRFIHFP